MHRLREGEDKMFKQLKPAIVSVAVMTVLLGLVFPFVITGIAKVLFPYQANGSLMTRNGGIIGSEIIGQNFSGASYFHPRPSAAGAGYDAGASGGTNLGPTSDKLINGIHKKLQNGEDDPGNFDGIKDLAATYREENGLGVDAPIPADAVTRSASGLDPHISPANARLQAARVARVRGLSEESVRKIVEESVEPRQLGILGEPRVNVLTLNLKFDTLKADQSGH
jgi:K+-transporting ATPase ATPase C chain